MNLSEMRSRGWLIIDDNEANPREMSAAAMTGIINDAIRDISPYLNIVKSATLTFTDGVASLPTDYLAPVAVYDGTRPLNLITDVMDKVDDTASTSQFFIPNATQIYIFGKTPSGTVTLWYRAYEEVLNDDSDKPLNIPVQFHKEIPETYVKAVYKKQLNQMGDYATLMNQWEDIKRKIQYAVNCMKSN